MRQDAAGLVLERVLRFEPELLAALNDLHGAAVAAVNAEILGLCRNRVALLLGAPTTGRPTTELTSAQNACLALTEQFVLDVAGMTDDLVNAVATELGGDGLVNFVNALLVIEQRIRMQLTFDRLIPEVAA